MWPTNSLRGATGVALPGVHCRRLLALSELINTKDGDGGSFSKAEKGDSPTAARQRAMTADDLAIGKISAARMSTGVGEGQYSGLAPGGGGGGDPALLNAMREDMKKFQSEMRSELAEVKAMLAQVLSAKSEA